MRRNTETNFWSKITQGDNGHYFYVGESMKGYPHGRIRWKGRLKSVHRIAFELRYNFHLRDDELIVNTCGNNKCCCPEHLKITDRKKLITLTHNNKPFRI